MGVVAVGRASAAGDKAVAVGIIGIQGQWNRRQNKAIEGGETGGVSGWKEQRVKVSGASWRRVTASVGNGGLSASGR